VGETRAKTYNIIVVIVFFFWVFSGMSVIASMNSSQNLLGSGTVKAINISVFKDAACTQALTAINYGTIEPGGSATAVAYLKNTGTSPLTASMSASNWNPSACSSYMNVNWNLTDVTFQPGQVKATAFTLQVASSVSGINTFTFDITITGIG
jgi:hypothetical protein